ncbi:MAG: DUF2339 domain-containing protein [Patescibacteria group bacterium]
MIDLILVLAVIVLFIKTSGLGRRANKLQNELISLKAQGLQQAVPVPSVVQPAAPVMYGDRLQPTAPILVQNIVTPVSAPAQESEFMMWLKENPLLKVGILMILVGFGWFVNYAFSHNWIGPVGRITLGVFAGTVVTLVGTTRLGKNETQGNALTILGTALVIITILAGQYFFDFFSSYMVLGITFMVSLYTSLTSVAYSSKRLAVYGMLMALLAPVLAGTVDIEPIALYAYLLVVSIAGIWMSIVRNWREVGSLGITGVFLYSLAVVFDGGPLQGDYAVLFMVYIISILYLVIGVFSLIQNKVKAEAGDAYLTIVNTLVILGFTLNVVPDVYQSLVVALWMLVYAFSGFLVFIKTKKEQLFYVHALVSVLLLAIATSLELKGQTLVIAFAIESALIAMAAYVVTGKIAIARSFAILTAVPVLMTLPSFSSNSWNNSIIFHSDFAVLVIVGAVLGVLGLFYKLNRTGQAGDPSNVHQIMLVGSSIYVYALIWLCSHSIIGFNDTAVFVSLFIYTIVGLSTHFYGLFNQHDALKKYGMVILILVVARLVLVDVWNMDLVLRVVTFIVLGVMFMSSAFISKNQKANVIQN